MGNQTLQPNDTVIKPDTSHCNDNIFFSIKLGVIIPQGSFSKAISDPGLNTSSFNDIFNNLTQPFKGIGGLGAKPGFNLQFEGFSSFRKNKSVHFGLEYGLDFGYIPLSWNNVQWSNYNMSVGTSPFLYVGLKAGPAFYFNPAKNMGIGIYGLIDPFVTAPGGENAYYNYTDASGTATSARYNLKDSTDFHFNIDLSAGINIYYKAFIIGVEYNWIHTKYNGEVAENESRTTNGVVTYTASNIFFKDVINTNILKITFGIRLGYGRKHDIGASVKQ